MIRHSPCELYIKFLLSHPDTYSNEAVIDLLHLKQLDFISPSYLDRLRGDMRIPSPFIPNDLLHWPSVNFLLRHRLTYLYQPDVFTKEAFGILDDAQGKAALESLLISDDSFQVAAYRMRSLGIPCSETRTIERYHYFFFNTDLVDDTELRALLKLRYESVSPHEDEYDSRVRSAMSSVSWRDQRKVVANQPIRQLGSLLNQLRMGMTASQFDLSRLVSSARYAAVIQAHAAMIIGGKEDGARARDYTMAAGNLTELLEKIGVPEAGLQKDMQLLQLTTEQHELPHIAELTDGKYTVDLQPTSEEIAHVHVQ